MTLQRSFKQQIQVFVEDLYIQDQNAWASKNSLEEVYGVINVGIRKLQKQVIDKVGFIHPNEYGKKTAEYFYTLILHADYFKKIQKEYIAWLKSEDLLKVLDKYDLEKRIKELKEPLNLGKYEFLRLQEKWFGKPMQPMSYFAQYDFIRPFYTTKVLGNLLFKYGNYVDVAKSRKEMLQFLNSINNMSHKITSHDFVFVSLKNQDKIAKWPHVLKEGNISLHVYNFETATIQELEKIGLGVDALIFSNFKDVKAGGFAVGDCYVLIMFAPKQNIGALVHIGTPGLSLDLIGKVFIKLQKEFNVTPKDLYIMMGPGILKEHYIYEDISKYKDNPFVKDFLIPVKTGIKNIKADKSSSINTDKDVNSVSSQGVVQKYHVDLFGGIRHRLLELGVPFEQYRITPQDTYASKFLFSHVRSLKQGDPEGRFMVGFVNIR